MFRAFVFNNCGWKVLVMPWGMVKYGFSNKEEAEKWSNIANYILDYSKGKYGWN